MTSNLTTVQALAKGGPFSEASIRWWIFNAASNGMAASGALVRIGRRVYIDSDRFEGWIRSNNGQQQAAA